MALEEKKNIEEATNDGEKQEVAKKDTKELKFSLAIKQEKYANLINDTLGDKETAKRFVAEISSVVGNNYQLSLCTANSIISAGLLAQTLNLPLASSLGFCYLVPYKNKYGYSLAQFQIGWKGIVQLAIRTGQYETIGVKTVHKGEVVGQDEFGDDIIKFDHKFDNEEIVGFYAYFKLISGFKKTLYWTKEQCDRHGAKYSKAHQGKNAGGENDKWASDFETMAQKTVLKQLISKFGIMSIEMQKVIQADQAVIDGDKYIYVDNEGEVQGVDGTKVNNRLTPKEETPVE